MFLGKFSRMLAGIVLFTQAIIAVTLISVIPAPESIARASEPQVELEAVFDAAWDQAVDVPDAAQLANAEDSNAPDDRESAPDEVLTVASGAVAVSIPTPVVEPIAVVGENAPSDSAGYYTSEQLRQQGVIYDDGHRYTWYSQRVLPGGGLDIEGRHVSDDGYVVDGSERIVVASSDLPKGSELDIPFGSGKAIVLDCGCASGTIDVYTDF